MVSSPTKEVTIDRISNNGNPIAQETHNGKTIHVPSGLRGETYEVRLIDRGSYVVADLVHKETGLRSRGATGPSGGSGNDVILELGKELIGDEPLTMEQRESTDKSLDPGEYPGKDHRTEIASRYD